MHSGGFHIAFDLSLDRSLGFILPTWVGPPSKGSGSSALWEEGDGGTLTVLPLKRVLQGEAGEALRRRFEDIQPTLLLFLQRLRRITVQGAVAGAQGEGRQGPEDVPRVMVNTCSINLATSESID